MFINVILDRQWSKYENVINSNKYVKVKEIDLEKLTSKQENIWFDDYQKIVPIKIRKIYLEVYYQIQKYEYLNKVADYKTFIESSRKDHTRKYATNNAVKVLKGEVTDWKDFIVPIRPVLRLIVERNELKYMIHEAIVFILDSKVMISRWPYLCRLKVRLREIKEYYKEKLETLKIEVVPLENNENSD